MVGVSLPNFNPFDPKSDFLAAMRGRGLALRPLEHLRADGHIHRCDVPAKGSAGSYDGSYCLHIHDNWASGWFTNWIDGRGAESWHSYRDRNALTPKEWEEIREAEEHARSESEAELAKLRILARKKARSMWNDAREASSSHPYCKRKRLKPDGLRMWQFKDGDNPLLVPMRDKNGKLVNLQFIHEDSSKHGLKGGPQKDVHYWINKPDKSRDDRSIYVCEGWATGETIFQATGNPTILAFNSANLPSVALWVHQRYPANNIIIAVDDDWKVKGNPGLTIGREAARAVGGLLVAPSFDEATREKKDTDFNDMYVAKGLDAVKQELHDVAEPASGEDSEDDQAIHQQAKQADTLIALTANADLFHDDDRTAYADVEINGHWETWPIRSTGFQTWLRYKYFLSTDSAPAPEALRSALAVIEAKAQFEGKRRKVFLRVGTYSGKSYVDLADAKWRAVEIDGDGWRVVDTPPVRFRRAKGMLPLPVPVEGGTVEELRHFLNLKSDDDFVLLGAWMVAALRATGPYPILKIWGEPGSAKSTLVKMLRDLIDPNKGSTRRWPREDRDLFIAANNSHLLSYDNVSTVPDWLSNSLCSLATGGSFATRTLYTDSDEHIFDGTRPVILNGVENFMTKFDLADRCIVLELEPITDDVRQTEQQINTAFVSHRPRILGALFDLMAHGIRELPNTKSEVWPRMADFAQWASACEGAAWQPGAFKNAYDHNRALANRSAIEDDVVATALAQFMEGWETWSGRTGELLTELTKLVGEEAAKSKHWPSIARALTSRLQNAKASLRRIGISVKWSKGRTNKGRKVIVSHVAGKRPSRPSRPSQTQ